ncbi:MAG: riboflavin synthase [Nitriliruptoraceae bacterium]
MFTGIVEELGNIAATRSSGGIVRLHIEATRVLDGTRIGDSVAVDGCCLTVTELHASSFSCDLMAETQHVTTLGELNVGDQVHLERALSASGRFDGHMVQGHIDGVGTVGDLVHQPGATYLTIRAPESIAAYVVPKGSVTIAGVSLTVISASDGTFTIGLIPHTIDATKLGQLAAGDRVNLEADVIAKYVERLLAGGLDTPYRRLASEPADKDRL